MAHIIEAATSGRAKCRGCGQPIARGELRFGERVANPYAEGETTLWFHLWCAAYKRPEPLLEVLTVEGADVPQNDRLVTQARKGVERRRLPRIDGADRAPTSQARCRHCQEPIERGTWRVRLVYYDDQGRFSPGGFVHLACGPAYFETRDIAAPVLHFSRVLDEPGRQDLEGQLAAIAA